MPRKLFVKEKTLQLHLTKWAHQGVFCLVAHLREVLRVKVSAQKGDWNKFKRRE